MHNVRPCGSRPRKEGELGRAARTQPATAVPGTGVGSAVWDRARRLQQTPRPTRRTGVVHAIIQGAHLQPTCQVFPQVRSRAGARWLPAMAASLRTIPTPYERPLRDITVVCPWSSVVFQDPAEPLATLQRTFTLPTCAGRGKAQDIALALMIALVMIVLHILVAGEYS